MFYNGSDKKTNFYSTLIEKRILDKLLKNFVNFKICLTFIFSIYFVRVYLRYSWLSTEIYLLVSTFPKSLLNFHESCGMLDSIETLYLITN